MAPFLVEGVCPKKKCLLVGALSPKVECLSMVLVGLGAPRRSVLLVAAFQAKCLARGGEGRGGGLLGCR